MIHGVLPSCWNDPENKMLSDSSDATDEKQSPYTKIVGVAQLWLICSKFSSGANLTAIWINTLSFNGLSPWLTRGSWNDVCFSRMMDGWWFAGSILTLIAQDESSWCPAEKCPHHPTMGHHGWAHSGLAREKLVARSSEGFHRWSSDQQTEIIWSCQPCHHFRRREFCADTAATLARQRGVPRHLCYIKLHLCYIALVCRIKTKVMQARLCCIVGKTWLFFLIKVSIS